MEMTSVGYIERPIYIWLVKNPLEAHLADAFYERIKDKDTRVLRKYAESIFPQEKFFDTVKFIFNQRGRARLAAVRRVLLEDRSLETIF